MAETIVIGCDGIEKWYWYNVMHDLETQGGLKDIINLQSVVAHRCDGQYKGNRFYITWVYNQFLFLTMEIFSQELVDAFAKVVGYQPFCRYERDDMVTVEWNKNDPQGRFTELQKEQEINDLRNLSAT